MKLRTDQCWMKMIFGLLFKFKVMHKKQYILKSLIAGILILAFACSKEQSFKYKDINTVSLEEGETSFTKSINDSLIITPKLIETLPAGDDYSYTWLLDDTLISNNKDLHILVNKTIGLHSLRFTATNNNSGVQAVARYALTIRGTYYGGWWINHTQAGQARVSLIRADDVVFLKPLEDVNDKTYDGKALSINYFSPYITVINTEGVWKFNHDNLQELQDITTIFPTFTGFPLTTPGFYSLVGAYQFDQVLILEGNIYASAGPFFSNPINAVTGLAAGDYNVYPAFFELKNTSPYFFYDNKNKRFVTGALQLYSNRTITAAPVTTGAFNMADMGRTLIGYDGTGNFAKSEYYFIMTDGTTRSIISVYNPGTSTSTPNAFGLATPGIDQPMLNCPDINTATKFAASSLLKQLYYASGNKIYLYDIVANNARLAYTFPAGYVVKELKRASGTQIVAATSNGGDGEVYYFNLSGTGDFVNNTFANKFTGFGEIEAMVLR